MMSSQSRHSERTVRTQRGIGHVTPDDEHSGRGAQIRKARRQDSNGLAVGASSTIASTARSSGHDDPQMRSNQPATVGHLSQKHLTRREGCAQ
jgi:hypothetical protein